MTQSTHKIRKVDQLLKEYGESHQHKINKTIHWICVPVIFYSIFGLIRAIPFPFSTLQIPYLSWASIILLFVLIYYAIISPMLFIGFIFFGFTVVLGNEYLFNFGRSYLLIVSVSVFIIAWIGQFIGHHIEGKKPSFFKDLQFLLIGPAWLMHFIYKKTGIPY